MSPQMIVMMEDAEVGERIDQLRRDLALSIGTPATGQTRGRIESIYNRAIDDVWRMVGMHGTRSEVLRFSASFNPTERRVEMETNAETPEAQEFAETWNLIVRGQESVDAGRRS